MVTEMESVSFELPDGRLLAGIVDPEPHETAFVWCHGTPFPVVPWSPLLEACRMRGLRLVAWARPGYGASTPHPGRRVVDFADDARHVLDSIGAADAIAAGWSGGGPHALSLGAALATRCRSVLSIASVAPSGQDDLEWVAGMGPENVDEFERASRGGEEFDAWLEEANAQLAAIGRDELAASMAGLISPIDAVALEELGMAEMLAACIRSSGAGPAAGWRDDDLAFLARWGFDADDVTVPVSLWQGTDDLMVPLSHGRWLADRLPHVTANLVEGEGHLSLLTRRLASMVDQAVELAGRR